MNKVLSGCKILYTRATAHWMTFANQIIALGGEPYHLPLMATRVREIEQSDADFCQQADDLIFTSVAAVNHFPKILAPGNAQIIAIGEKTHAALVAKHYSVTLTAPPPYHSESLLSVYAPQAKKIAIIAAPNGRKHLYQSLNIKNKTRLIYAYERYNPSKYWLETLPIPNVLMLSSIQTLKFLLQITPQTTLNLLQCRTEVIALSKRIAHAAHHAGFLSVSHSEQATETAQIQTLCQWWLLKQGVSI